MNPSARALVPALLLAACSGQTISPPPRTAKPRASASAPSAPPPPPPAAPKELPPDATPPRPLTPPRTASFELPNGLEVVHLLDRAAPVVHLRLVVRAGTAVDGETTGLASVCAHTIAEGQSTDTSRRLDRIGASITVDVGPDRVLYGLSVPKTKLAEAASLLAAVVGHPPLSPRDVARTRTRLVDAATEKAEHDPSWANDMVLYRDLFALPSEHHPYASYDATAEELARVEPSSCKRYHRNWVVPKNMLAVITGDVTEDEARSAAKTYLGPLRGAAPPALSFTDPMPPESTKLTLVDRPGSKDVVITIGTLAPRENDPAYAAFLAASAGHGGTVTTFAQGPSILKIQIQIPVGNTSRTLSMLQSGLRVIAEPPASQARLDLTAQLLAGRRATRISENGGLADEIADLWARDLPEETPYERLAALRAVTPEAAAKILAEHVREGHAIVVVRGDAGEVGPLLQPFGEVKVVDPTRNFARVRTLPSAPGSTR